MNDYGQDLDFEIIIPKLKGTTSIQIFKSLSEQAAAHLGVSASALFDLMIKKEEEASSGIGGGVATALMGLAFGLLFWAFRRNLWPLIIAHAGTGVFAMTMRYVASVAETASE